MESEPARFEPLRVLTFVLQTEVLVLWLFYAVLLVVLLLTATFLPSWAISLIWWIIFGVPFLHFAIQVIEATSQGRQRVPLMTLQGFRDVRVLALLLLASAAASLYHVTPADYQTVSGVSLLVLTPPVLAILATRASLVSALNPVLIVGFIANLGLGLPALRLVLVVALLHILLVAEQQGIWRTTVGGTSLYAVVLVYLALVMFRSTGAVLHDRRHQLGVLTAASPEQAERDQAQHEAEQRREFLQHLRDLIANGDSGRAWHLLSARLARDQFSSEAAFYDDLCEWQDPTFARKVAQGYIRRLFEFSTVQAWRLYASIHEAAAGNYRLDSGETVIRLAETASNKRERCLILETLMQFDNDFPEHPRTREAYLLATDIACQLGDYDVAATCFLKVTGRRGLIHRPTYDRCRDLLSRISS